MKRLSTTLLLSVALCTPWMTVVPVTTVTAQTSFWHVPVPDDEQHRKVETPFQLTDYHIHIRGGMTTRRAIERQKNTGILSGVIENSGREWPLYNDTTLQEFIFHQRQIMDQEGVWIPVGMQVNDRDWYKFFSPETLDMLDYVISDTMVMDDENGVPIRLWETTKYVITDEEAWMERYFQHTMQVLNEPITILANPTYLPEPLASRYDHFWTEERMKAVIDRAVKNGVALEIQAKSAFPNEKFIRMAKEAGAKFSVGTNNFGQEPFALERWFKTIEKFGLEESDFIVIRGRKTPK